MKIGDYVEYRGKPGQLVKRGFHDYAIEFFDETIMLTPYEHEIKVVVPPKGYKLTGEYTYPVNGGFFLYGNQALKLYVVQLPKKYWILEKEEQITEMKVDELEVRDYVIAKGFPGYVESYNSDKDWHVIRWINEDPNVILLSQDFKVVTPPEGYKLTGEYRKAEKGEKYLFHDPVRVVFSEGSTYKYWILEKETMGYLPTSLKEEKMASIGEVKVDINTEHVQTLVDSIAELQNRLDRVENGESVVKKSMLKRALYFPIKIMIGRMVLTTLLAASAIGYTYYKGTEFTLSKTSQEVISYIPAKKLLKVLDNGEEVQYTLTDEGWMSLPNFKLVDNAFLERVGNQILIEGIGQKSLPVEKRILFWSWIE